MENLLPLWVYYVIGFPLLLGPLVTAHELGHYLVARWFGVEAKAFSVGFGKEIWGYTDKRGTRWKLAALPLGGYVQFKGDMNPASIPDANASAEERRGSFHHAALWKRALIVFAGPATNIILTLGIFAAFFMVLGNPVAADAEEQLTIGQFAETSPARDAGLAIGDRIVAVEGEAISDFRALQDAIMLYPGRTLVVTVDRSGANRTFPVTVASETVTDRFGNSSRIGRVGIASAGAGYDLERQGPIDALVLSAQYTANIFDMMITGIGQIFSGERSIKELGGPVKIAKYSGEQLSMGSLAFANFAALISLNLAFINLLPIPALDGGHLAFYAAEVVRRKPVGPQGQEVAYRAGVAILLAFMAFVTINDLVSLPFFGN